MPPSDPKKPDAPDSDLTDRASLLEIEPDRVSLLDIEPDEETSPQLPPPPRPPPPPPPPRGSLPSVGARSQRPASVPPPPPPGRSPAAPPASPATPPASPKRAPGSVPPPGPRVINTVMGVPAVGIPTIGAPAAGVPSLGTPAGVSPVLTTMRGMGTPGATPAPPGASPGASPATPAPPLVVPAPSQSTTLPLTPLPAVISPMPPPVSLREAPQLDVPGLRAELRRRSERLAKDEPVAAARVLVELGLLEERTGGEAAASRAAYEQARSLVPTLGAALSRRRRLSAGDLGMLDEELRATSGDGARADLLAERGRSCQSLGRLPEARAAFHEALRLVPTHAASLRGLLASLEDDLNPSSSKALAGELEVHLGRLTALYQPADGGEGDARLAAWLHTERAALLDQRLGQAEQAQVALGKAVALQPAPGPVRDALTRFLITHKLEAAFCTSLAEEAEYEADRDRSARLLYTAARLRAERLKQPDEAVALLMSALARSPSTGPTRRRVLLELARLHEEAGRTDAVASIRVQLLAYATEPVARAHEHVRLHDLLTALGRLDDAAQHARQALTLDPADLAARQRLDGALGALRRHDERVALWVEVANQPQPPEARVEALLRAAAIAEQDLARPVEATGYLRTAWALLPGHPRVFDALSALLTPPPREADDARGVRTRLELYTEAARSADDTARKVALLEKIASIYEDELFQPGRAADELARVLALEPQRRTAILALQRTAARSNNPALLLRALTLEADATAEPPLKRRLLLRAADVARDRLGDRATAFLLLERAEALDPANPDALRARANHARDAGRFDEARKALLLLIGKNPRPEVAFPLWIEVAQLDEQHRKNLRDAVASYRQAARFRPGHPLAPHEIARLLRQLNDARTLVEALTELANTSAATEQARLLVEAADMQELALGDDDGALRSLSRASAILGVADVVIFEASERILLRRGLTAELISLYRRWLDASPPTPVRQRLRIALALLLQESNRADAIEMLDQALRDEPDLLPALRLLRHLRRRARTPGTLAPLLEGEADVLRSGLARRGALWELAALEEQTGQQATLVVLERIAREDPRDGAALDGAIRIAGQLATTTPETFLPRLRTALRARRELLAEPLDQALFFLEEALVRERETDDNAASDALQSFRAALAAQPDSLLAARGMARLAERLNQRDARVTAETALGRLVDSPTEQALHLVRAADLLRGVPGQRSPVELYEQALACDADCTSAATSLALLLSQDPLRLVDRLGAALDRAQSPPQVLLLGAEIGRTVLAQVGSGGPDPTVGLSAVQRALDHARDNPALLMLRARLERASHLWPDARATLQRLLETVSDRETRVSAHFELTDLYRGPLLDLTEAQNSLQAVLSLDPRNRRALETLHEVALQRTDHRLAIEVLSRLAEYAPDPSTRVDYDLRLADAYQNAGDARGRVTALCDAVLSMPNDQRPWEALARLFRSGTQEGAAGYADALSHLLRMAAERDVSPSPRWLSTLGLLEATVLFRPNDALEHLQKAAALPGSSADERAAYGLGLEVTGRNLEAIRVLRDVLSESDGLLTLRSPGEALANLEAALAKEGRAEEQLAVQEARACLGEMPSDWVASLRSRRLPHGAPQPGSLGPADLPRLLLPPAGGPMINVAMALSPIVAGVVRFEISSLGLLSRERLSPRDNHPTRQLADRIARALALPSDAYDIYLSSSAVGSLRVFPGNPPILVAPLEFDDLHELEQAASLAIGLVRVALGLPFLDELPVDALDGLLFAALLAVEPTLGPLTSQRERSAQAYLPAMQRAIGRRQRKQLEELAPLVVTTFDIQQFVNAVRTSEQRLAYLLSGSLVSTIDALRRSSRTPDDVRRNPAAVDLIRYALTEPAAAERRRLGTVWTHRNSTP